MVVQYSNRSAAPSNKSLPPFAAVVPRAAELRSPEMSSNGASSSGSEIASKDAATPFLTKTYDMVDNPSTDPIVSWSNNGNSFVVWNSSELQKEVLPKYFKHSNFSSFVRQLNTYGFRKVDPDRWEFANDSFIRGQKQLLKGIHRRKPSGNATTSGAQQPPKQGPVEVGKFGLEGEIERLKRDKNVLMMELVRLRQHQQQTDRDLQMILQRLHITEQRQQQMVSFLAKAMQSPGFLSQLVQQNENKKRLATAAARKKRRLPKQNDDGAEIQTEAETSTEGQIVKYQPNNNDPVAIFLHMLNSADLSSAPKMDLPNVTLQEGIAFPDMHRSRMVEDLSLSPMRDFSDVFPGDLGSVSGSGSGSGLSSDSGSQIQVAPGTLMRFENVDMDQETAAASLAAASAALEDENLRDGNGNSASMHFDQGLDFGDEFWNSMLVESGGNANDLDFEDSFEDLSGMGTLSLQSQQ